MSNAARSLYFFGIYLSLLGLTLVVAPNLLLLVLGVAPTGEVWIRVAGMLLLILAFFYIQAARHELIDFIRWSVYTRASVILFFIAFVVLGYAPPILLLVGMVDLVMAMWTMLALRRDDADRVTA